MKWLIFFIPLMVLGGSLSELDREYVDKMKAQYTEEWDYYLTDEQKRGIIEYMEKSAIYDLSWSTGAALLVESRGIKDRVNINYTTNKNGKDRVSSFDCGKFGSNTYYYLKDNGVKNPTMMDQINACHDLNHDVSKSYYRFINTHRRAMEIKDIKKLKGTKEYWWRIWTFYNTGTYWRLKGMYYLRMIAAVEVLKEKVELKGGVFTFWEESK